MVKIEAEGSAGQEARGGLTVDELARLGAPRMRQAALEAEGSAYVAAHWEERDAQARALVVRHGQARGRKVTLGSGMLAVHAPRGDDRRVAVSPPPVAALQAARAEGRRGAAHVVPARVVHWGLS